MEKPSTQFGWFLDDTKMYCVNCRTTHEMEFERLPSATDATRTFKRYRCTTCKRIAGTSGPKSNVSNF